VHFFTTLKTRISSFLGRMEFDRAVYFGIVARIWGGVAGPVTAVLIISFFSPILQGYYYTFANLLALQIFAELGFGLVIVQFASHEWSKLRLDETGGITGDPDALSRLTSLARFALKWYATGGVIFAVGLSIGGYFFFSRTPDPTVDWVIPWFALCLFTGINLCFIPIWSLLEGCNQVIRVYRFKFYQGLIVSSATWILMVSGAKLWIPSISCVVVFVCSLVFLIVKCRRFFETLFASVYTGKIIAWRSEILPMQWKIALSWICGYFAFFLFTPVLFHYQGARIAGQFGMSWNIVGFIGAVAASWVSPKVPQFGMLIARREYGELDALFWRVTKTVVVITGLLTVFSWFGVLLLNVFLPSLAQRLLPPLPFGLFLLAQFLAASSMSFPTYLRTHKIEPLLLTSILSGFFIGLSTLILGKYYSVTGMAIGYLAIQMISVPCVVIIWHRCRKLWHAPVRV